MSETNEFRLQIERWFRDKGDYTHRLNYNLNEDSVVIDLGGYKGEWAEMIFQKHKCNIHVFEPVIGFYNNICDKFKDNEKIKIYGYGLGSADAELSLSIEGDASSSFKDNGVKENILIKDIKSFLEDFPVIDLIKINIEGGEFDLLDYILDNNLTGKFKNIQVQFHTFIADSHNRCVSIQNRLSETHELTYNYPFVWENWVKKNFNPKIPLLDSLFHHANNDEKEFFTWDRQIDKYDYAIVTNKNIGSSFTLNKKIYCWLLESPEMFPDGYDFAKSNIFKFEGVFTFSKEILDNYKKSYFVPAGSCWIKEKDRQICKKSKLVSIIASDKNQTSGHKLRLKAIEKFTDKKDVFGIGYNLIADKITGLKDYMFSVAIENTSQDYYFTEKLLDCFATGTIPIYYGCPSISKFFNVKGIIIVNSIEDIENALKMINQKYYYDRMDAIKENFELCVGDYLNSEKYMFKNHFNILKNIPATSQPSPLNSFVNKVYCINLERRTDRWERMNTIFNNYNIVVEKHKAIDGKTIKNTNGVISNGQIGCLRSHRAVIQNAIDLKHEKICVFEDDLILKEGFNEKFESVIRNVPPDWDMIYLGCHFHGLKEPVVNQNEIFCKIEKCFGVYGVIIRNTVLKSILDVSKYEQKPMDDYLVDMHPRFNIYCAMPFLVKVSPDYSDIANVFEEYNITGKYF